jgi:hypothetical protein
MADFRKQLSGLKLLNAVTVVQSVHERSSEKQDIPDSYMRNAFCPQLSPEGKKGVYQDFLVRIGFEL